jgi:hypothetical protein
MTLPDGWWWSANDNPVMRAGADESGEYVTVIEIERGRYEGMFKYICDGEWSDEAYDSIEEAIDAAEEEYL